MNYFLDLVYQLLAHPRVALRTITRGERLAQAAIIWGAVIFLVSLSSIVEGPGFITVFGFCVLGFGITLLLHSAVIDYAAGMLGGRGSAKGITAGFMASSMPYAFSVFSTLLSMTVGSGAESLLGFVIAIWGFVLDVIAVSENYGFSTGKSVAIALIPAFLCIAVLLALILLGAAAAIAGISQMEGAGLMTEMMQEL